jgi:nitrogen regulatory protein P-II 1
MTSISVQVHPYGVEQDRARDDPARRLGHRIWLSWGGGVSGSGSPRLVQIVAMVKPFRAQAVLAALESVEILGGTVREAMGYGRQKNRLHRYLGSEYNASFLPKVEITLVVHAHDLPVAVKAIVGQARTGRMGDGKILILPCYPEHLDL